MKSNIDIVKDYLAGVRPITQVGYTGKKYVKRVVGEKWTDAKGQEWVQRDSGPEKVNRVADIVRESIGVSLDCKKCGLKYKWASNRDLKVLSRTGLCEDCLISYETNLRVLGIYESYETYRLADKELGAMHDMKDKINETIKYFKSGDTDVTMLCNSEGFTERWKTTNADQILENAEKDLVEVNRRIDALVKIRNEQKEKYVSMATQNGLDILCQTESKSPTKNS